MRLTIRILFPILVATASYGFYQAYETYVTANNNFSGFFDVGQVNFILGEVPTGSRIITVEITNRADVPRRILGAEGQCRATGCFQPLQDTPVILQPGESVKFLCELTIVRHGMIDITLDVYLEENGIRTVTLHVTGTAVEAPRAPQ